MLRVSDDILPSLLLVLTVIVLLFAGSRLGRMGDALGAFVRNLFRSGKSARSREAAGKGDDPQRDEAAGRESA